MNTSSHCNSLAIDNSQKHSTSLTSFKPSALPSVLPSAEVKQSKKDKYIIISLMLSRTRDIDLLCRLDMLLWLQ